MSEQKQFKLITRKGYDFFECSSAFQKCIRRADEKNSIFFGVELAGSGWAQYLWKRMLIIASEDVGLANNGAIVHIKALYDSWQIIADKNHEEGVIPIIHAIMVLARSPKSRIVDDAKLWALKSDYRPDIPDFALDVHTRRGKAMGRDHKYFMTEGRKVENEREIHGANEYKSQAHKYLEDYANGNVPITGYDPKNVYHKTTKDKDRHVGQTSQSGLFK